MAVYEKTGLCFQYPDNWSLDEEEADRGQQAISVFSPGGAFWTVIKYPPSADPKTLTVAAMRAIEEEYDDFEAEPAAETIAGQELTGFDLNFYCLDLTNTALIRGFRTNEETCVIVCQAEDRDFRDMEPVFRAMTTSLIRGGH